MQRTQEHIDKELQEEFLVIIADTIVNPRAMMVHACYASFTNRTVVTERRFYCVTLLAVFHDNILKIL